MGMDKAIAKGLAKGKLEDRKRARAPGQTGEGLVWLGLVLSSILLSSSLQARASAHLPEACQNPRIVVVGMDEQTRFPEPFGLGRDLKAYRAHNATLIEQLNRAGVAAIGFDFYYAHTPGLEEQTTEFVRAAQNSKAPVVIGVNGGVIPGQLELRLEDNDPVFSEAPDIGQGTLTVFQSELRLNPLAPNAEATVTAAHEFAILEGIWGSNSLVHEMALRAGAVEPYELYESGLIQPVDAGLIQFQGSAVVGKIWPRIARIPPESFCTLSYIDVYRGAHQEILKNSFVLVGMMDEGLDRFAQPDPAAPELKDVYGVYLHAAALAQILDGDESWQKPDGPWWLKPAQTAEVVVDEISHPGDETLELLVVSAFEEATAFMALLDQGGSGSLVVDSVEVLTQILEDLHSRILHHIDREEAHQLIDSQQLYNQLALLEYRINQSQRTSSHPLAALDPDTRDLLKQAIFQVGRHLEGVVNVAYFFALAGFP